MGTRILAFATALVLADCLTAQEHLRPTGIVVDESGAPIAGAIVRIVDAAADRGKTASTLTDRITQQYPLPFTRSNTEGRFELLIHPMQIVAQQHWHKLGLIVEKPGYRSWREHLLVPFERFTGSRVVLPKLSAPDLCRVIVDDPRPGMKLEVSMPGRWNAFASQGFYPFERRLYDVPADGQLQVEAPMLPLPARAPATSEFAVIRYEARLLYPGRTSEAVALVGGDEVRFADRELATKGRTLRSATGEELQGVRGLYRYASGAQIWQPLDGGGIPALEEPKLLALVADGHAASTDVTVTELKPLPENMAGRRLRLVNERAGGISAAKIWICPLTVFPLSGSAEDVIFGDLHVPYVRSDERGGVSLSAAHLADPCFLMIEAPGFAPLLVIEPRRFDSVEVLELRAVETGAFRLRIVDENDDPVVGAMPILLANRPGRGNSLFRVPGQFGEFHLSDDEGMVLWEHLPAGLRYFQSTARAGYRSAGSFGEPPVLGAGAITDWTLHMNSLREYRVRLVDADGNPVPYAVAKDERWTYNADGTSSAGIDMFAADGEGWLHLWRTEADGLELQQDLPWISEQPGKRIAPGEEVDLVIRRIPSVVIETDVDEMLTDRVLLAGRRMQTHSSSRMATLTGSSILLRTPLNSIAIGVRGAPPISFATSDEFFASDEPIVRADRSKVRRWVPLTVTGPGTPELSDLEARPFAMNRVQFRWPLDSDMAARDEDGNWHLVSRDDEGYDCKLVHPSYLVEEVRLPSASASNADAPIEVALRQGKPIKIRTQLSRDYPTPNFFRVNIMTKSWSLFGSGREVVLVSRVPFEGTIPKGPFEFQLPCGLELGTKYVIQLSSFLGISEVVIEVEDLEPETIEISAMKR